MKTILRISLAFNLALLGGLIFILWNPPKPPTIVPPVLPAAKPPSLTKAPTPPPQGKPQPFRWTQLENPTSYRAYIANLRAIGCPESTVEDIARGDADRAFSWKRRQLGLDGSGSGPWSRLRETELVASLLGLKSPTESASLAQRVNHSADRTHGIEIATASVPSPATKPGSPSYPLFLQNVNWKALGFTPDEQAAIFQVRQQFQSETAKLGQNTADTTSQNSNVSSANDVVPSTTTSSDSAALTQWQKALQNADDQLRASLGAQGYMAYEQQRYDAWLRSSAAVTTINGKGFINVAAFH